MPFHPACRPARRTRRFETSAYRLPGAIQPITQEIAASRNTIDGRPTVGRSCFGETVTGPSCEINATTPASDDI
ncbi:hypothetical protein Bcep1808_5952 [Burkholderia vietnamiensis G4]|uniref:Uncharacterized protein n=1 Tax=Burkholderia vietnamiensis (strain G4 / LMG 22486) TaxID=269482 RepID=A4JRH4_BURVG|nr:hypothetical protein Bcep1808_5952 [Burkholderia vietnamiensis G4]